MSRRAWLFSAYGLRTLWAASLVVLLALAVASVYQGHGFNATDYGAGVSAIFAIGGWGVSKHDQTGPGV